ncbi:hypothetical protein [Bradyrhizobium sp. USDA 4451]
MTSVKDKVQILLNRLSSEERQLLGRVLKIEKENLYQQKPRGLKDDLMRAVREIIK